MVSVARDIPRGREPRELLPTGTPLRLLEADGQAVRPSDLDLPDDDTLLELYRRMVVGRRFDAQATALTKQGRLAVYPSAPARRPARSARSSRCARRTGCSRPTATRMAIVSPAAWTPSRRLTLLRGDWHTGYDPLRAPRRRRSAPRWPPTRCTPSAFAHAARLKGEDTVALVMLGDGATSEGDSHEALNFAAVLAGAGRLPRAEQRLRHQRAARQADRGADARRTRPSATACPAVLRRRQRRGRRLRGRARAVEAAADRRRPDAHRGASPTGSRRTPTPTTPPATATRTRSTALAGARPARAAAVPI